jgi:hypothetical protein
MNILAFSFLVGVQILLTFPFFNRSCIDHPYFLYFVHHAFDVFLFWAPLFLISKLEYGLHFLFGLGVGIHWFMNDNKCVATVEMNKQCGYEEERWLDSLKNMFDIRNYFEYFHFMWIGILMVYDLYVISK